MTKLEAYKASVDLLKEFSKAIRTVVDKREHSLPAINTAVYVASCVLYAVRVPTAEDTDDEREIQDIVDLLSKSVVISYIPADDTLN